MEYHVSYALIKEQSSDPVHQEETIQTVAEPAISQAVEEAVGESEEESEEREEDDGWQVVRSASLRSKGKRSPVEVTQEDSQTEELTKRQRESRRKRERKKEVKELMRTQAQEQGLHARWGGTNSKMKYVPPPTRK